MAEHKEIYQRAVYYDIVFCRDVRRDIGFMQAAFQCYAGRELSAILDIACGPGYHARTAARMGLRAVGMDLRPEMLDFAKQQAPDASVEWLVGNMCDFQLDAPVDMAACFYDSIDAMLTDDMLVDHFRAVAQNLNPRGLYIVECIHPRDCSPTHYGTHRHRGTRDGVLVECVIGTNRPEFDPVTGIGEVEFQMHIFENGQVRNILEKSRERLYSPQTIKLLAEKSGALEVVGWFGDFDLDQPLDNTPGSQGMVGLLQKTGA
jgi:SAM-dependent methyltransferase